MTVLLVEDEDRIASFVEKGLRTRGFEVRRAATGREALEAAGSADVVVLDLGLPDVDGLEVLPKLRAEHGNIPVVIVTARGDIEDRVAGLDLGAEDYVTKPFAIEELAARLRARVRARRDRTAPMLRAGGLELDVIARRARVDGRTVELTPREFALLEALMRRAGQTVTREELLAEVRGFDFDPRSNLVEVYVRYLRRKIGPGFILTERGIGYRVPLG